VDAEGSYSLANVPMAPGQYRVRVVCPQPDGTTLGSTSAFQTLVPLGVNTLPTLPIGVLEEQPSSLKVIVILGALTSLGATAQLELQAIVPGGYAFDASLASKGATYTSSNTAVASVSPDSLVTATGPGNIVITVRYGGLWHRRGWRAVITQW
jgi:hypothetical protein